MNRKKELKKIVLMAIVFFGFICLLAGFSIEVLAQAGVCGENGFECESGIAQDNGRSDNTTLRWDCLAEDFTSGDVSCAAQLNHTKPVCVLNFNDINLSRSPCIYGNYVFGSYVRESDEWHKWKCAIDDNEATCRVRVPEDDAPGVCGLDGNCVIGERANYNTPEIRRVAYAQWACLSPKRTKNAICSKPRVFSVLTPNTITEINGVEIGKDNQGKNLVIHNNGVENSYEKKCVNGFLIKGDCVGYNNVKSKKQTTKVFPGEISDFFSCEINASIKSNLRGLVVENQHITKNFQKNYGLLLDGKSVQNQEIKTTGLQICESNQGEKSDLTTNFVSNQNICDYVNFECAFGTQENIIRDTTTGDIDGWSCVQNQGRIDQTTTFCHRNIMTAGSAPIAGICSKRFSGLCLIGENTTLSRNSTHTNWKCLGINGGNDASCSLEVDTEQDVVNGECGDANTENYSLSCAKGVLREGSVSFPRITGDTSSNVFGMKWVCDGTNTGFPVACTEVVRVAASGRCGEDIGECEYGEPTTPELSKDESVWEWMCEGDENKSSDSCEAPSNRAIKEQEAKDFFENVISDDGFNKCSGLVFWKEKASKGDVIVASLIIMFVLGALAYGIFNNWMAGIFGLGIGLIAVSIFQCIPITFLVLVLLIGFMLLGYKMFFFPNRE